MTQSVPLPSEPRPGAPGVASSTAEGRVVGQVVGLYTAAVAGAPMESHEGVEVVPGVGIPGDRYATRRGYWSDPKWPDQELTLVEAEVAAALGVEMGQLRRNIVTQGVRLSDLIGVTFQMGGATLYGVRPCDPCAYIESLTRPGMLKALAGQGGLRTRIVQGGRITVGEAVLVRPQNTG